MRGFHYINQHVSVYPYTQPMSAQAGLLGIPFQLIES